MSVSVSLLVKNSVFICLKIPLFYLHYLNTVYFLQVWNSRSPVTSFSTWGCHPTVFLACTDCHEVSSGLSQRERLWFFSLLLVRFPCCLCFAEVHYTSMSRAGFFSFSVSDLLGFLHLWIVLASVLENSQPLSLQIIPSSYSSSGTIKCSIFPPFSVYLPSIFTFLPYFPGPFSPQDPHRSGGLLHMDVSWPVADTSSVWSLGGVVVLISAGPHSWCRLYLFTLVTVYCVLLWEIIVGLSWGIKRRCLSPERIYTISGWYWQ